MGYRAYQEWLAAWAWLDGDWDLAAGQFFTTFRRDVHVVADFDETRAREWFAALDYGFAHHTVVLLGCTDGDGVLSRNPNGENSCGFAIIVAEQAAESLAGMNGSDIWELREFWSDDLVLQTLMVSLGVIMQNEFANNAT
jgi:hypothetical protein